jgi:GH18 family chitinase
MSLIAILLISSSPIQTPPVEKICKTIGGWQDTNQSRTVCATKEEWAQFKKWKAKMRHKVERDSFSVSGRL